MAPVWLCTVTFPAPPPAAPPPPTARLPTRPPGLVPGFGFYLRTTVANGVQSGNGRTQANDNNTDYYPVALKDDTLRPGTIYADPYGHVLVLARRVPQSALIALSGADGAHDRNRKLQEGTPYEDDPF